MALMLKQNLAIAAILSLATACANEPSETHRGNLEEDGHDLSECLTSADCEEGQYCAEVPFPCPPDEACIEIVVTACVDGDEPTEPAEPFTPEDCPGCGLG